MSFRDLDSIDQIIVHCADTPNGFDRYGIADIDAWHAGRGFCRSDEAMAVAGASPYRHVGYHYVIHVDGSVHEGRELIEVGAHARGHNRRSIGVCLIGRDAFTRPQWSALRDLHSRIVLDILCRDVSTVGHRNVNGNKSCPGFDVLEWRIYRTASVGHICEVRHDGS